MHYLWAKVDKKYSYLVNIIYQICLQDTQIDFYVNKFVIKYNK